MKFSVGIRIHEWMRKSTKSVGAWWPRFKVQNSRLPSREGTGVKSRMCPPYPQRDRKRRLNGAVCRNHRIKGWSRVGARTGTLKNPTKCLWRWEPDRRSNFFFSPPAHLCAVTYMTEILTIVTLNNQFTHSLSFCSVAGAIFEHIY